MGGAPEVTCRSEAPMATILMSSSSSRTSPSCASWLSPMRAAFAGAAVALGGCGPAGRDCGSGAGCCAEGAEGCEAGEYGWPDGAEAWPDGAEYWPAGACGWAYAACWYGAVGGPACGPPPWCTCGAAGGGPATGSCVVGGAGG